MKNFFKSFLYAFRGIGFAIRRERNFQIECAAGIVITILMFLFPLSTEERSVLVLTMAAVFELELVNTALERVMDILKPRIHPYARVVKDVMAGAVVISACAAVIVGIIIFSPYLFV